MINLLLNSGFEIGTSDIPDNWWTYNHIGIPTFLYPEIGRIGGSSVAISSSNTLNDGSWIQSINVDSTKTYKLLTYAKTQNISVNGTYIGIDWFDISYNWISYTELVAIPTGTTAWSYYEKTNIIPPSNAVRGNVLLESWYSSGTVWFDDISLSEVGIDMCADIIGNFVLT